MHLRIGVFTESSALKAAVDEHQAYLLAETLSKSLTFDPLTDNAGLDVSVGEHALTLYVEVVDS